MRIAILNSVERKVLPQSAGGGETWTAQFAHELASRKHVIDFFATRGSLAEPNIILHELSDRGTDDWQHDEFFTKRNDSRMLTKFTESLVTNALLTIKEHEQDIDLVIDSSTDFLISSNWSRFSMPLVVIGHLPITYTYTDFFKYYPLPRNVYFTFPSKFQYNAATQIPENNKYFIPHGIDIKNISQQDTDQKDKLVWLGRISRKNNKGLSDALQTARQINKKINIYGYVEDQEYFEEMKQLIINESATYIQGETNKSVIFSEAKVFLFPIQWEEAFGLVLLEAMAAGTPVIAFARGAIPEIIKDGETGFIINPSDDDIRGEYRIKKTGIAGLCEAVEWIYTMPESEYRDMRQRAREHVEQRFTIEHMADQYEELFQSLTITS